MKDGKSRRRPLAVIEQARARSHRSSFHIIGNQLTNHSNLFLYIVFFIQTLWPFDFFALSHTPIKSLWRPFLNVTFYLQFWILRIVSTLLIQLRQWKSLKAKKNNDILCPSLYYTNLKRFFIWSIIDFLNWPTRIQLPFSFVFAQVTSF